jgi:tRNA G46 methylase TrmB
VIRTGLTVNSRYISLVGSGRYVRAKRQQTIWNMEASAVSPDSTAIALEQRRLDGPTSPALLPPATPQQHRQRLLPSIHQEYTSRKPTWWKQRAGKATKGQRRVMALLQDQYSLRKPVYGEFLSWGAIFPTVSCNDEREIWLEIGFGLGDNLLCLAARSSPSFQLSPPFSSALTAVSSLKDECNGTTPADSKSRCYVGAEIHSSGLGTLYTRIQSARQAGCHWNGYSLWNSNSVDDDTMDAENSIRDRFGSTNGETESSPDRARDSNDDKGSSLYHNLRIFAGDGTKLLPCLPDSSVAAVIIAFPDPFAATHEEHWRLLQLSVLHELRRILRGPLYLATDHEAYYAWSHAQVARFNALQASASRPGFTLVEPTPHRSTWLPVVSKYEQKGWDEGRSTHLSCWV